MDQAFYAAALARRGANAAAAGPEASDAGHERRVTEWRQMASVYDDPRWVSEPDGFFVPPEAGGGRVTRVGSYEGWGEVLDVRWSSAIAPHCEALRARIEAHEENAVGHARLFAHRDRPRPAAVLVHGYLGGVLALEERLWPVRALYEQGLDVALFVLPYHGARRRSQVSRPVFPSSDPRLTVEGFRQAIFDLRWLKGWLEARGASSVGVMGMSLGGYTTALLATVEAGLSFAVPLVPLASLADFARDGGRLVGTAAQRGEQHAALDDIYRVVSPLARPSRLPVDRVVVVAGRFDRVTPVAHAERLAQHLGAQLELFDGGHLLQIGRAEALAPLERIVERLVAHG